MKRIYNILKSNKTGIVLIVFILIFFIIGTIIPQQASENDYIAVFGEPTYRLLKMLMLTDVYHSIPFLVIVVIFFINMFVCNIEALISLIKIAKERGALRELKRKIYALGIHLSLYIMLSGFILTAVSKIEGSLVIKNGESTPISEIPGLKLKLNRFWIDYIKFGNRIFPKDYFSDIELYKKGDLVKKKRIEVNHPLKYKGVYIYQTFYQQYAKLAYIKGVDTLSKVDIECGKPFSLPDIEDSLLLGDYKTGTLYYHKGEGTIFLEPIIKVYSLASTPKVLLGELTFGAGIELGDSKLALLEVYEASGLTYRKDIGVPIVYFGGVISLIFLAVIAYSKES